MSPAISTQANTGFFMETSDKVMAVYIMHPNGGARTGNGLGKARMRQEVRKRWTVGDISPALRYYNAYRMGEIVVFLARHGYALLFAGAFFETLGLPMPCAPLFVAFGALAGAGRFNLLLCVAVPVCAALLGDFFWYSMGRRYGGKVLSLLCRISLEPDSCVHRAFNAFYRYGACTLLVAKFIPGVNIVSTPVAGMIRMRLPRFLLFAAFGLSAWAGTYTLLGYFFTEPLRRALTHAAGMARAILFAVAGAAAILALWKYIARRRFLREIAVARIAPEELKRKLDAGEDVAIFDVRHGFDLLADPYVIPGAVVVALEELERGSGLSNEREVVVYCTCPNEVSSAMAARTLQRRGILRARPLAGGLPSWRERGYPLEETGRRAG